MRKSRTHTSPAPTGRLDGHAPDRARPRRAPDPRGPRLRADDLHPSLHRVAAVPHRQARLNEPRLPIETDRLRLRAPEPEDLAPLHAIMSREDVARWLYWEPRSVEDVSRVARPPDQTQDALEESYALVAELLDSGEMVGHLTLSLGPPEHRQAEIGFMFHPDHQGRGYATEASPGRRAAGVRDLRPAPPCTPASRCATSRRRACWRSSACAARPTLRRERVGQGRVAERGDLRPARPRMAGTRAALDCPAAHEPREEHECARAPADRPLDRSGGRSRAARHQAQAQEGARGEGVRPPGGGRDDDRAGPQGAPHLPQARQPARARAAACSTSRSRASTVS